MFRKRGRCDGDDESRDFTPLSKRINNLHINNGNHHASVHEEVHPVPTVGRVGEPSSLHEGQSNGGEMGPVPQPMYNPDLNVSDNPFYYEPNKLLYYLNMERMQRTGQSF
ncbi:uncharacterized protein LOC117646524 isoform X2 [Thrips palmi]|uniref:Uncharacterized protein LOC117646524 isoform X2 n=1 Tax=Thrips palmi TaxID=161013 RepID=A0A6P8Z0G3_THRPL|nr:uncharacterized protein LOC117646524 isoform X2 [Thrips palmi]